MEPTPDIKLDGHTATTFQDKARLFRHSLFPPPPTAELDPSTQTNGQHLQWPPISPEEIRIAINSSSSTKAPGPDSIGFECIKVAYSYIPEHFNSLYKTLLHAGHHPTCWKEATVVIIKKLGKPDYGVPKAYRPISLLNCLGKISEKIMASRLAHMAEKHQLLHHLQIGGRPKRSAVDAVMLLTSIIDQGKREGKITSTLCIDVKGAFDNVYKQRLLQTLKQMQLNPAIIRWVNSFLTDRLASLAFDVASEPMTPIMTGIPQGSPVSPILFLLYLQPLFAQLEQIHPHITCPSYIDDICLLTQGKSVATNARKLEEAVTTCFNWGKANAVAFDDPKSELMHYSSSRNPDTSEETYVKLPNGTVITPSDVQRWLGIWLDRKLSWKDHIKNKIHLCNESVHVNLTPRQHRERTQPLRITTTIPKLYHNGCGFWF
jgi:hypothetical protein